MNYKIPSVPKNVPRSTKLRWLREGVAGRVMKFLGFKYEYLKTNEDDLQIEECDNTNYPYLIDRQEMINKCREKEVVSSNIIYTPAYEECRFYYTYLKNAFL